MLPEVRLPHPSVFAKQLALRVLAQAQVGNLKFSAGLVSQVVLHVLPSFLRGVRALVFLR